MEMDGREEWRRCESNTCMGNRGRICGGGRLAEDHNAGAEDSGRLGTFECDIVNMVYELRSPQVTREQDMKASTSETSCPYFKRPSDILITGRTNASGINH
ncbi:hypothetical protein EYF80_012610 [Liparis tanakae]|uniref:Uncharacterized protein n=1 Tax=Liparis tanakae TaxID=230148 RepID=A0A4Z2IHE3_9TELE|nr:hypothetical protein EYF80_012610 [Liparis tanakae]